MENIQTNEILNLANCLEEDNDEDGYNKSYYHFVKYFEGKDEKFTEHELVIGANFTYGWIANDPEFKSMNLVVRLQFLIKQRAQTEYLMHNYIRLKN